MNSNKRIVNFLICGAQKCGTSTLDAYLRKHPEICMAEQKEVHFFDLDKRIFSDRKAAYSKYHSFFKPKESDKLLGESTPIYMYWYAAPRRIWEYNSNMKLIVLLRNPIERAYSHWNMMCSRKIEQLSFWDAIKNENERCREFLPLQSRWYSYVDRGFYLEQLRRLWFYFPREQVLIIKSEYMKNQPASIMQKITDFLGINFFEKILITNENAYPYREKMGDREKEYLRLAYEHEILGLERILGWDCSDWLAR